MKISNILLSGLVLLFVGCGSTGESPETGDQNNQNQNTVSTIPPLAQDTGMDYNITSYFFPFNTLNESYTYKDYQVTETNSQGFVTNQEQIIKHYLNGIINGSGNTVVTVFQDNRAIERNVINSHSIDVYNVDEYNNATLQVQYHHLIQINADLLRNANEACVLKQKGSLNLGDIIPVDANPNSVGTSTYNDVLYFHCGSSDGVRVDRYFADGYGEVAQIYEFTDGSITYTVFNKNTDQNP